MHSAHLTHMYNIFPSFLLFSSHLMEQEAKRMKKLISTSKQSAKQPFASQNAQHLLNKGARTAKLLKFTSNLLSFLELE